jgi:hypothetical protein
MRLVRRFRSPMFAAVAAVVTLGGCLSGLTTPTSNDNDPVSSTPYALIHTKSGTSYKVTYESFRWRWADLMGNTDSDLYLRKSDCVVVTLSKSQTTRVEYRGKTVSGCRGTLGNEFVVRHSGGTTQAWETSTPGIGSATGKDFSTGSSVSVGLSSLDSVDFYR